MVRLHLSTGRGREVPEAGERPELALLTSTLLEQLPSGLRAASCVPLAFSFWGDIPVSDFGLWLGVHTSSVCYGWIFRFDHPRACAILGIDVSVWKLRKCQKIPSLTLGVWLGRDHNVMGSKKNEYKEHFRHSFMSPTHPHFRWFAGLSRNKQVKAFWIW